jgi:hypothetical protein
MDLTFELLCVVLCDPLWFNDLCFTTKSHQDLTKVHKGLFQQPQSYSVAYQTFLSRGGVPIEASGRGG